MNNDGFTNEDLLYLSDLTNMNVDFDDETFMNKLYSIYSENYKIIKNYILIEKIKKNDFKNVLNKRKSIFLFENIDISKINFYLVIWKHLHS